MSQASEIRTSHLYIFMGSVEITDKAGRHSCKREFWKHSVVCLYGKRTGGDRTVLSLRTSKILNLKHWLVLLFAQDIASIFVSLFDSYIHVFLRKKGPAPTSEEFVPNYTTAEERDLYFVEYLCYWLLNQYWNETLADLYVPNANIVWLCWSSDLARFVCLSQTHSFPKTSEVVARTEFTGRLCKAETFLGQCFIAP